MKKAVQKSKKIAVIGPAIVDALAAPVDFQKLRAGSLPMNDIIMSYGGDALNEAVVLNRLGADVELISKIGTDQAGDQITDFLLSEGISCAKIKRDAAVCTSINIVLVDDRGERFFLTNPNGSMRRLAERDLETGPAEDADIVSFAGMFISQALDIPAMTRIFKRIKERSDRILAVDMTKAKNGETLRDLEPLLPYVDYMIPNEEEISLLTGKSDAYQNAKLLIEAGVGCAVIKRGERGCLICEDGGFIELPAYPVPEVVDSTGAGDSFTAGFLYGLSRGFTLRECGVFANATASCIVEDLGATRGFTSAEKAFARFKEMTEEFYDQD